MRLATFDTGDGNPRAGEVIGDEIVAFDDGSTLLSRIEEGLSSSATCSTRCSPVARSSRTRSRST